MREHTFSAQWSAQQMVAYYQAQDQFLKDFRNKDTEAREVA